VDALNLSLAGVPFTRYNALFVLASVLRLITVLALLTTFEGDAPGGTRRLIRAMLETPVQWLDGARYRINRRRLRKRYDQDIE